MQGLGSRDEVGELGLARSSGVNCRKLLVGSTMNTWWGRGYSWNSRDDSQWQHHASWSRASLEDKSGTTSPTPTRRPRLDDESSRSPQGKVHDVALPRDFVTDSDHLDSREVFGKKFFRKIQLTSWSQKFGLAGRPIEDVKLHEIAYGGWKSFYLRHLSYGMFTTIVFARKINEAAFVSKLLAAFRESSRKWDIDTRGKNVLSSSSQSPQAGPNLPVSTSSKNEDQKHLDALVDHIVASLQPFAASLGSSDQTKRIHELEAQLQKLQNDASHDAFAQPSKRRKLGKQPVDSLADNLLNFQVGASARPLAVHAPPSMTATAVKKWMQTLSIKSSESFRKALDTAEDIVKELNEDQKGQLQSRAVQLGLPFTLASKGKPLELMKVILAALALI